MNPGDDPLGRLLGEALDAQARAAVDDQARPPVPRYVHAPPSEIGRGRRPGRLWAPLAAVAAVVAVVAGVLGFSGRFDQRDGRPVAALPTRTQAVPSAALTSAGPAPTSTAVRAVPAAPGAKPVRVSLINSDGQTYGVGMPVIALFSAPITDGRSLQAATTVKAGGRTVQGAWYFERSQQKGRPMEGHFRPRDYWPAHTKVHVDIAAKGLSAGDRMGFANSLSLDFATGAAQVITVDDTAHEMTVVRDGATVARYPVSLGSVTTPTTRGIKVIMEKGTSLSMVGPGYSAPNVAYTQRVTYGGEYLHAAPWNVANIENGRDTSNGCTNLRPGDAKQLYATTRIGDVVAYPNADGRPMSVGAGYGDWNVSWREWLTGGLVPTR